MGGGSCTVVIIDGNLTYGVLDALSAIYPEVHFDLLEAAVRGSCAGISYASTYYRIEDKFEYDIDVVANEIVSDHTQIMKLAELNSVSIAIMQKKVNQLTEQLIKHTRKLYKLESPDHMGIEIKTLIHMLWE